MAWKAVHERHDGAATFDESTPGVHIGDVGELITLPAFLSPNVLQYLVDTFDLRLITNAEDDIKTCLKQNI